MFFVDSANIKEIKELNLIGIVDGVTTNPTLIYKSGGNYKAVLKEICEIVDGPISAEVIATEVNKMIEEGLKLSEIAENIIIKVPCTKNGLQAAYELKKLGKKINVTLCFSSAQALLAAKVGADYISPFIGRLEDIGQNGINLIEEIAILYENSQYIQTKILAASIRSVEHILSSIRLGAHVVTAPPKILNQMFNHPLTDKGLEIFLKDWADTNQKIE
jgi:transaldolase